MRNIWKLLTKKEIDKRAIELKTEYLRKLLRIYEQIMMNQGNM